MTRIALVALAALAVSCGSLTQLDVPFSESAILSGGLNPPQSGFSPMDAGQSASRTFANQGVTASEIKSAKLTQGTLAVTSPPTGDLTTLSSFEILVEAPGQPEQVIAHQDQFAAGERSVPLILDDVDLKPYLTASSMTFTPRIQRSSKLTVGNEQIELSLNLHVQL